MSSYRAATTLEELYLGEEARQRRIRQAISSAVEVAKKKLSSGTCNAVEVQKWSELVKQGEEILRRDE